MVKTSSEIKLPCIVVWLGPELRFWRHFPGKNQPSVSWDQTLLNKVIWHHVFWIQPIIEVWFDQPIIPLHVLLWQLAWKERAMQRLELVILNAGLPFKKKTVDFTQIAGTIFYEMYLTIEVKGSRTTLILFRINSVKFASGHANLP